MNLLDISILNPVGSLVWAPMSLAVIMAAVLWLLSLLRNSVNAITDSEARILHHHKTTQEQRIYMFYQRKEKVKAALASAETFAALLFVVASMQVIQGHSISPDTELIAIESPAWPSYALLFVIMAFVLVISIIVPGRMMSSNSKHKLLMKMGWLVDSIAKVWSLASFTDSYSNSRPGKSGEQLTVSIGMTPPQTGEKEMIRNILQFGDIEVREIMTPRHDIVAVDTSDSFLALKQKIAESSFSRIPVFEDKTDNIFGIIYVKDLIAHISENDSFDWATLVRRITFVPENKKISDLLREFQQSKNHMAAVSDEYGGISGLITMQDILEKIVGEISDEFDIEEAKMLIKVADGHYICDGRMVLDDFCREMHLEPDYFDDLRGDAESVAGVLLEICGEFPALHKEIQCHGLRLSVEQFSGRRIEKIGVRF